MRNKTLVSLGALALALLGVLALVLTNGSRGPGDADATAVRAEPATVRPITVRVSAPGRLEPGNGVKISARVSARIAELPFEAGDRVEAGDVLVRLDDTDLAASLRARKAQYAAQRVDLGVAEANLRADRARLVADEASLADAERARDRAADLFGRKAVSRAEVEATELDAARLRAGLEAGRAGLEAAEANLDALRFRLDAAQADIDVAQGSLDDTTITSPIGGTVTRVDADVGELVVTGTMNNPGTVILEVADLGTILVVAQVDEADIARVKVGQAARVDIDAYADRSFEGTVRRVALARMSAQDLTDMGGGSGNGNAYRVDVELDTAGVPVLSDLTADVEILTATFDDPLTVPTQAVLGHAVDDLTTAQRERPEVRQGKTRTPVVYRVVDGRTVATPVAVGASDLEYTIVASGLEPGERIVTGPFSVLETLHDDMAVRTDADGAAEAGGADER